VKNLLPAETPPRGIKRRAILQWALQAPLCAVLQPLFADQNSPYADGRPAATLRMEAVDSGRIIQHGAGPARCDYLGAREAICFQSGGTYYLHYDGAGPTGWRACLAVSRNLKHWDLKRPVLDLGSAGEDDAGTASSPWTIFEGKHWHVFYVGSRGATPPPNRIPAVPYFTLAATSSHPQGPWTKQKGLTPFRTKAGSYYSDTASPGQIVKQYSGIAVARGSRGNGERMPDPSVDLSHERACLNKAKGTNGCPEARKETR
jgi:hypothetical protein